MTTNASAAPTGASTRGSHRLAAINTCERLWALRYYYFIRPINDNEWRLGGTLIHTTREYYYANMLTTKPAWFYERSLEERLKEQAQRHPKRVALVSMAFGNLRDYIHYAEENLSGLTVLGIEEEETVTLGELDPGGPWPELDCEIVTCRNDMIYRRGARKILDYKSHGRSKTNTRTGRLTKWRNDGEHGIDWQAMTNLHLTRLRRGADFSDFVIARTTRQPVKEGYYDNDHHTLKIPTMAYEEMPRLLRRAVKKERDLMGRLEAGTPPVPDYAACMTRFGPCDYRYACMAEKKTAMLSRLAGPEFAQSSAEDIAKNRASLRVIQ